MPNQKYTSQLLLEGKFEIDQNSLSEAAKFAQELSKTLEAPLQEMTKRIVESLVGPSGLGKAAGLVDQYGTPVSGTPASGGGNVPPPPQVPTSPIGGAPPPQDPQAVLARFLNRDMQPWQIRQGMGKSLSDLTADESIKDFIKKVDPETGTKQNILAESIRKIASPEAEMEAGKAGVLAKMKQAGVDVDISPKEKEQMKSAAAEIREGLKDAFETIKASNEELVKKLNETTEEIKKQEELITKYQETEPEKAAAAEQNKAALEETKGALTRKFESNQEEYQAEVARKTRQIKALEEPAKEDEDAAAAASMKRSRMLVGGLGVVAAGMKMYGELPTQMERHEAGMATATRFGSRSFGRGDEQTAEIIQELGGQESMYEEASRREKWKAGGGLLGSMVAGGVAGTFVGGPVGTVLGAAGAGIAYGVSKYGSFGKDVAANQAEQTANRAEQFQEYYDARRVGKEKYKRSYADMVGMGLVSQEAEDFLYGKTQMDITPAQPVANMAPGTSIPAALVPSTTAPVTKDIQSYAAERSIGGSELYNMQRSFMQSGGEKALNEKDTFRQMVNLQSMGLSNTADMQAGALERLTTNDPKKAFELIKDMYADAVASGMDKTKIAKSMEVAMAQVSGYGSAELGMRRFGELTDSAKTFAQGEQVSGPMMDFLQRIQSSVANVTGQGGSGLGQVAGFDVAREAMNKKVGETGKSVKEMFQERGLTGSALEFMLGQNEMTPESIQAASESMGYEGGLPKEAAEQLSKEQSNQKKANALLSKNKETWSQEWGVVALSQQLGLRGTESGFGQRALESLAKGDTTPQIPAALMTQDQYDKSREGVKAKVEGEGAFPKTTIGGQITAVEFERDAIKLKAGVNAAAEAIPSLEKSIVDFTNAVKKATDELQKTGSIPVSKEQKDVNQRFIQSLTEGMFGPK